MHIYPPAMERSFSHLTIVFILFSTFSCASAYNHISPQQFTYSSKTLYDNVQLGYKYDVLRSTGNAKYAKHERKESIKLVALKVTNNSETAKNLTTDYSFYIDDREILPLSPQETQKKLKQGVAIYSLYFLLMGVNGYKTTTTTNNGKVTSSSTKFIPLGIIAGPAIAIGNMAVAKTANNNLLRQLQNYDLNRTIEKGQTSYILIAFKNIGYDEITMKPVSH